MERIEHLATNEQRKEFNWAIKKMQPGQLYALFLNNEILKEEDAPRKLNTGTNQRISPVTGNHFITKAYFCAKCGELFIQKQKKINLCYACNKDKNAKAWKRGGTSYNKRKYGLKARETINCYRCEHLLDKNYNCTMLLCKSFNFMFREERAVEEARGAKIW